MGPRMRWMRAAALLAALAACGPSPAPGTLSRAGAGVIVRQEIEGTSAPNLLELVQRLRPAWIQERTGAGGRGYPVVYVGSQRQGGIERLREMHPANVLELRFLNGPEASARFGRGVTFGVIQVVLDVGG